MIFVHVSGERQQPPPDSPTERALLDACKDPGSGWSAVDDANTVGGRLVKRRPAPPTPTASEEG